MALEIAAQACSEPPLALEIAAPGLLGAVCGTRNRRSELPQRSKSPFGRHLGSPERSKSLFGRRFEPSKPLKSLLTARRCSEPPRCSKASLHGEFGTSLLRCFVNSLLRCFIASLIFCFVASLLGCFVDSLLRYFIALLLPCFAASLGAVQALDITAYCSGVALSRLAARSIRCFVNSLSCCVCFFVNSLLRCSIASSICCFAASLLHCLVASSLLRGFVTSLLRALLLPCFAASLLRCFFAFRSYMGITTRIRHSK